MPQSQSLLLSILRSPERATRAVRPAAWQPTRHLTTTAITTTSCFNLAARRIPNLNRRHNCTDAAISPTTESATQPEPAARKPWRAAPHRRPDEPVYELYFTCNTCKDRSGHSISKQGYHNGTVLVRCPGCQNRHLISDHLKIFSDKRVTLEDLMREKGQTVRMGSVDQEGDVEFWNEDAANGAEQGAGKGAQETTAQPGL